MKWFRPSPKREFIDAPCIHLWILLHYTKFGLLSQFSNWFGTERNSIYMALIPSEKCEYNLNCVWLIDLCNEIDFWGLSTSINFFHPRLFIYLSKVCFYCTTNSEHCTIKTNLGWINKKRWINKFSTCRKVLQFFDRKFYFAYIST